MAQSERTQPEADILKQSDDFFSDVEQKPSSDDKNETEINNCVTTKSGAAQSRESIFISDAFSFLPPDDEERNGTGSEPAVPSGGLAVNSSAGDYDDDGDGGDDDDDDSDGNSDEQDDDDNDDDSINELAKEDKTATVNSVLDTSKSNSSNILRKSGKDRSSSGVDGESGLRVSRLISREFGFLSDEKYSEDLSNNTKLSTLEENDADPNDKTDAVDAEGNSAGDSAANSGVTMRQKSVISAQSIRPSNISNQSSVYSDDEDDDEDDDVNIDPGAWRTSKFMYVNGSSDTTSDGSITDSPRSSPSPRHVHRLSIYPPQTLGSEDVDDDSILVDDAEVFEMETKQDKSQPLMTKRSISTSTTVSEKEFRARYQSLKKTKIIRKASFNKTDRIKQQRCTHTVGRKVVLEKKEDETEFGFHVWGRRPVIISTVEEGSVADRAGLQIGDVLVTLNSIDVSEASIREVVEITKKGLHKLTLGLSTENRKLDLPLCCGYLNKLGAGMLMKKWRRRWVELKSDHCLYYYKDKSNVDPLGAVPVVNYTVTKATEIKSPFAFKLTKYNARTYYFIAESGTEMSKWADAIKKAGEVHCEDSVLLDISSHNVGLPALCIRKPECCGILYKMGNSNKAWRRRYCVLKEGCLFYYENVNSSTAKGVVHFHGYVVEDSIPYNKQFGFKLVPPDRDMRTFYFYAENETEMKRWTLAFTQTLSNWVMVSE